YNYAYRVPMPPAARPVARRLIGLYTDDDTVADAAKALCSEAGYTLEGIDGPAKYFRLDGGRYVVADRGPAGQAVWGLLRPAHRRATAQAIEGVRETVA